MRQSRRSFSTLCLYALSLITVLACEPVADEICFLRADKARDGVYVFELPLTDSTAVYDLSLYSRSQGELIKSLELRLRWISPNGQSDTETVYMREVDKNGSCELYRSGIRVSQPGLWRLSVRPESEKLTGVGVVLRSSTESDTITQ